MPFQPPPYMVPPPGMELKASLVDNHSQGIFCKDAIKKDAKFGPFVGELVGAGDMDKRRDEIDFRYAWHIVNKSTGKVKSVVNATVPENGNWMRYVNCARYYEEQNIVSVQDGEEIYYQALKDIKPGEELLTWFDLLEPKKTRRRKRGSRSSSVASADMEMSSVLSLAAADSGNGKRLRKKKVSTDMLSLDDDDVIFASSGLHHNRIRSRVSSGLRRSSSLPDGQMMPVKKTDTQRSRMPVASNLGSRALISTALQTNTLATSYVKTKTMFTQNSQPVKPVSKGFKTKSIHQIVDSLKFAKEKQDCGDRKMNGTDARTSEAKPAVGLIVPTVVKQPRRSNLVGTAEYMEEHLSTSYQFIFEVTQKHRSVPKNAAKRVKYACDVCEGKYRKAINLKRHYLREHINQKYLSKDDITMLSHKKAVSTDKVEADVDPDADDLETSENSNDANDVKVKTEAAETETSGSINRKDGVKVKKENEQNDDKAVPKPKLNRAAREQSLKSKPQEGKKTFSYNGTGGIADAFRCHLCVQLFPSVEKLKYHIVYDSHRSKGDKQFACDRCSQRFRFHHNYQRHIESHGTVQGELSTACHICGKKFLNEANMRKHLRFHSGRNFPCKYGCDVVYPNVAELVKHLRAFHPELPRKSQAVPVSKMDLPKKRRGRRPKNHDESTLSPGQKSPAELEFKTEEEAIMDYEISHPPGWVETRGRKPRPGIVGVHCTICKKKFSTYGSMCRHRRSVHRVIRLSGEFKPVSSRSNSPPPMPAEEDGSVWEDPIAKRVMHIEANVERLYQTIEDEQAGREAEMEKLVFSPPPSPTSFYMSVADNIAENLCCYLDGGAEALKNAQNHIKVDDYVPLDEVEGIESRVEINWSEYNFPRFFEPVDPVIPHPPKPQLPPPCLQGDLEAVGDGRTLAYPTRSAIAEREATRRASAGAAETQNEGVKERIPRRASVGALDKQNKDETKKLVRRASVGSFENKKSKTAGAPVSSTDVVVEIPKETETGREVPPGNSVADPVAQDATSLSAQLPVEDAGNTSTEALESSKASLDKKDDVHLKSESLQGPQATGEETDDVFNNHSCVSNIDRTKVDTSATEAENAQSKISEVHVENTAVLETSESTQESSDSSMRTSQENSSVPKNVPKPPFCSSDNQSVQMSSSPTCKDKLSSDSVADSDSCAAVAVSDVKEPGSVENDLLDESNGRGDSLLGQPAPDSELDKEVITGGCENSAITKKDDDTPAVPSSSSNDGAKSESSGQKQVFEGERAVAADSGSSFTADMSQQHSKEEAVSHATPELTTVTQSTEEKSLTVEMSASEALDAGEKPVDGSATADTDQPAAVSRTDEAECVTELSKAQDNENLEKPSQCSENVTDHADSSDTDHEDKTGKDKPPPRQTRSSLQTRQQAQASLAGNGKKSEKLKEAGFRSEHANPSLIKPTEGPAQNAALASHTSELSEKELEYLSKGITIYVRGNRERCPHVVNQTSVAARQLKTKEEEEYVSTLELTVKKITPSTSSKTVQNEKTSIVSESVPNTADTEKLNKEQQNPDRPTPDQESSDGSDLVSMPATAETATKTSEEGIKISEEAIKISEEGIKISEEAIKISEEAEEKEQEQQNQLEQPAIIEAATQAAGQSDSDLPAVSKPDSPQSSSKSDLDSHHDPTSQSSSEGWQVIPNTHRDDSDLDLEIMDLEAKLNLQILQEQVSIDREVEQMCETCRSQSTEHLEPSKRSAEDFMKMRFGRKLDVYTVCSLCRRYYHGVDSLLRHQWKKHPSIQCSHMEVENGHGLEMLFYPEPSTIGVLAESLLLPPEHQSQDAYTCTRCKVTVRQYSRLRAHIINCDPNTPTTPHTRKKKTKSNRHRFMEKMLPEKASKDEKSKDSRTAVRDLSFRTKGQGVIGNKIKAFGVTSGSYKRAPSLARKDLLRSSYSQTSSASSSPFRARYHHGKFTQSRSASTTPSKSGSMGEIVGVRARKRRNYELLYNPAAHVRRREKTECLDIHQCQGCGLKFKTLSLLERHTKNCSGKEKLRSQKPVVNKLLESQGSKKHSCHYCPKRFKYLKGVYNHYKNNFCRVRAERLSDGGLSAQDQAHETELQDSLKQQAWNKTENRDHTDVIQGRAHLHDDGTITHTKRKGGWPKGLKRSNKRRRHGWTYIKRRKVDGSGNESSSSPGKGPKSSQNASSAISSASATSAAMSELEARLREPVVSSVGKKRKRLNKALLDTSHSGAKTPATKYGDSQSQSGQTQPSSKGRKLSKGSEDMSQAPVIDRMDISPPAKLRNNKQMSPDLEPPILSPVLSPALPITVSQNSTQRKRKRKKKSEDSSVMENKKKKTDKPDSAPPATKTNSQPIVAPQMTAGEGVAAPIFVLEHVADSSGSKGSQFKLVQLKIPTVVPRLSSPVSLISGVPGTGVGEQKNSAPTPNQSLLNTDKAAEQKPLPPNFLFPPPSSESEQDKGKNTDSTTVGKPLATEGPVKRGRKGKPQKKVKGGETAGLTTINTLFKNCKSPTRNPNNPNTLKNMDAYRYEKFPSTPSSVGAVPVVPNAAVTATPLSPSKVPATSVPQLVSGNGMAMLPQGAVLAVLPNSPIMIQTSPKIGSPSSSSPAKPNPVTNATLHTAVAEGKLLLLDTRSLPGLLASGSFPVATSPTHAATKVNIKSPLKTPPIVSPTQTAFPLISQLASSAIMQSPAAVQSLLKHNRSEKDSSPPLSTAKPTVDIPNFLFDKMDPPDASSAGDKSVTSPVGPESDTAGQTNSNAEKNKMTSEMGMSEKLAGGLTPKTRSRKKPKRGPPPSSKSPTSGKVKSMVMMTSPGVHTMVSLSVASTSKLKSVNGETITADSISKNLPAIAPKKTSSHTEKARKRISPTRAAKNKKENTIKKEENAVSASGSNIVEDSTPGKKENAMDKGSVVLNVPVIQKRDQQAASPSCDSVSDDDLPLSAMAAKIKDK